MSFISKDLPHHVPAKPARAYHVRYINDGRVHDQNHTGSRRWFDIWQNDKLKDSKSCSEKDRPTFKTQVCQPCSLTASYVVKALCSQFSAEHLDCDKPLWLGIRKRTMSSARAFPIMFQPRLLVQTMTGISTTVVYIIRTILEADSDSISGKQHIQRLNVLVQD